MGLLKVDGFNRIYQLEEFQEEFEDTVSETKTTGRYHEWLRTKLRQLDALGYQACKLRDFEPLTDTDPKLYSIRYPKSPKNTRVLYIYVEGSRVYLLHAFNEKSKSDYANAIKTATNRIKSL